MINSPENKCQGNKAATKDINSTERVLEFETQDPKSLQGLLKTIPMAPSQLEVATKAVQRLVKEEASYHKELEQQEARVHKLESSTGDENAEYLLKQEVRNARN